jgi:hypothetical protein
VGEEKESGGMPETGNASGKGEDIIVVEADGPKMRGGEFIHYATSG